MARTRTRAAKPAKDDDLEITDAKTPPRAKTRPPPAKRAATALKPARRAPRRGAATAVKPARPGRRRAANDSSGDESLDPFSPLLTRAQRRQRTMEQAAAAAEDDEVVIIDEEDEEDEDAFVDVGALRAEEKGGELTVQHAGAISVDEDDLEDSDGKSSNDEEAAADDDEEDEEDNGNKIESDDDDEEDEEEAETQEEKNGAAGAILATPRTTRSGLHLPDKKAASSDEEAASLSEDEEGEGEADDSVKASLATPRTTRNGTRIAPPAVESASSDEEAASSSENEEGESEVEDAVKAILATPRTTRNGTRIAPPAEEAKESDEEAASSSEDGEDEGEADDTVKAILATPRTTRNGTRIAPPAEEAASSSEDEEEETNATAEAILATPRTTRNGTPIAPRDEEEASNDSDEEEASDDSDEEEASDDADGSDSAVEEGGDLISQLIARNGAPSKAKDAESEDENEEQDEEEEQDESEEEEDDGDGDGDDDDDDEERELEMSLFGNLNAAKARKELEAVNSGAKAREMRDADIFVVDKGPGSASTEAEAGKKKSKKAATAAAWEDDDDIAVQVDLRKSSKARKLRDDREETLVDGKEYSKRLREQFRKMNRNTAWAELPSRKRARREAAGDSEDMDDDDDEAAEEMALLRSSEPLTRRASEFRRLPPGRLHLSRLNDANQHAPSKAVVQSVVWHKQGQLLATAGYDKTVRIFKVDGKVNARVESVYLRDMPIFNAQFAGRNHEQLICVGRRRFFYWLDLESGSVGKVPSIMGRPERSLESMAVAPDGSLLAFMGYDGNVILVSQESKQWVANVKMNENASCAAFTEDGRYLYTGGDHGRVYCWDMRTRRILFRFQDQGSTWTRSLAVTSSNDRLAIGSSNGVVNLYEVDAAARAGSLKGPEPTKAIMSLTTAVDQVTFNGDGQLLALMSRRKQDAVRLFNTNTLSVVQNWPTAKTPVHYASAVSFSPGSGMLALGNDRGRCLLYRLNHYKSAA